MRAIMAALVVMCVFAAPARAHDSLAPAGAGHNWLPDEEWVHRHWLPFDERQVEAALGLRGRELEAYLYDDHHTLAALARARGVGLDALVDRLLAGWGDVPQRAVLRERTVRVLEQGHLAQHLFFHVFHGLELHPHSEHLFGMPLGRVPGVAGGRGELRGDRACRRSPAVGAAPTCRRGRGG